MTACVCSRFALHTLRTLQSCAEGLTTRLFLTGLVPQENHNFVSRRLIMTRTIALLFLLVFCCATAMQAQTQAPKPAPEVKKLLPQLGLWTYEREAKPGLLAGC
jgi:hypothetical protein